MSNELVPKKVEEITLVTEERWTLEGYDTFDHEFYPLDGEYSSEDAASRAAYERLKGLERSQPTSSSGGQFGGIQDRVFLIHPDGRRERMILPPTRNPPPGAESPE